MSKYIIVDGHEDIAFNALQLHRNFLDKILTIRSLDLNKKEGTPTISLPELEKGHVRIVFGTIWVSPHEKDPSSRRFSLKNSKAVHAEATAQLEYYMMLERQGFINVIRSKKELKQHLSSETKVGLVILMEGANPILCPKDANDWFKAGVRIVAPAWHRTRYSGGTGTPGPLTKMGKELMAEMDASGLILDVSHMAEESFFNALDLFRGGVIASHSNSRRYVPTDRQLTDEMIKALVSRNGVIGTVLFNGFLKPDWKKSKGKNDVALSTVVKHMKNVCEISGDSLHTGIGSDLDGGFGAESIPQDIDTVADLQKLGEALSKQGFSSSEVSNLMGGNWIRLLEKALPNV